MRKQAVKPSQERTEDDSTKTGAIQDADLPTGNQDPHERRRLSADQLFLQHLGKIVSNYPNMPDEAFANLLGSKFRGQANDLAQEKANQIKLLVEENFSYAWDVSLKLLGEELEQLISRISHIAVEPLLSKHKELELAKNTANFIVNSIADKIYLGHGVRSLDDLIDNLDTLHSSLCDFSDNYKRHHPALADLKDEPAAPPLDPRVTNTAAKARSIFAESFRPYSSLFEAIKKHDDTLSETSRLSGIELKIISDLSRKWAVDRILQARKEAKKLGLTDQHLYHVLKSADSSEMGYTKALGLLNDISEFAKSLSPIESRLPRLSPLVSPESFSSIEMLAAAKARVDLLRKERTSRTEVDASVKGTVAINEIAKLLVSMGAISKSKDSKPIKFQFPYCAAQLLVYAYASKIVKNEHCGLNHAISTCSFGIKRDCRLIYGEKKDMRIVKELWLSFDDLLQSKILIESPGSKFDPADANSLLKASASLATRISGPTSLYLTAIREIIGSINHDDESFISAILPQATSHSSQEASFRDQQKKGKKPQKNADISAALSGIDDALTAIKSGPKPHEHITIRGKINQLIADIRKYISPAPTNAAFSEQNGQQLLSIIKPPSLLSADYASCASSALTIIRKLLLPEPNSAETSERVGEITQPNPVIDSPLPNLISPLKRPDIIAKKVDNHLEDLSAEFIAAVYTRTILASCLSLDAVQTAQKEAIASCYAGTLRKYFSDQEFDILPGELFYKVTIFAEPELVDEPDFRDLCLEMVAANRSDIPVVVSTAPNSQSPVTLARQINVTAARQLNNQEIPEDLIQISLGIGSPGVDAKYQIDPESAIKTIKRSLKLTERGPWLNLENKNGAIILRPHIPLPKAAVGKIIDKLFWLQTPIYLDPSYVTPGEVNWSGVKSIIKLMLPPTATITSFKIRDGANKNAATIKLFTNGIDRNEPKDSLKELAEILHGEGLHLQSNIRVFDRSFLSKLSKFNRRTQLGLLKGLNPRTLEAKVNYLKSLNEVSVEPINMANTVSQYKDLTGSPIEVKGQQVFCIDTAGTKLAEDAFSIEVLGDKTRIGVHVVNGAFIVPPDSINRHIAYDLLTSIYGKSGVHQYMLPNFISSGFSPRQDVPSISMFIEIPTHILEKGTQDELIENMSVTLSPSVTRVGAMLTYSEETCQISQESHNAEIEKLSLLANCLSPLLHRKSPSDNHADDISHVVATLMGFFNKQVGDFIANNDKLATGRHQQSAGSSGSLGEDELYSKPLRDAFGLLGQHQLMAYWGYYSPISDVQFRALWEGNKKHLKKVPVHRHSLQLVGEVNQLLALRPSQSMTAISEPDEYGKLKVRLDDDLSLSRECYAKPADTSNIQPQLGDRLSIRSIYYSIMDDCFVLEY